MNNTVMVLVSGEALAGKDDSSSIQIQRENAGNLAAQLKPLLTGKNKLIITYGNKPQLGYVLLRSEIAQHVLHHLPLDVCGAQTQGATGYLLAQAFSNVLLQFNYRRDVLSVITQALVDTNVRDGKVEYCGVGPWFDQSKAQQYRQIRGWEIIEEPGRGYRRAVPSYPAKDIVEANAIKYLIDAGFIVVAGGGGGIPVAWEETGQLEGVEIVIETEQCAHVLAKELGVDVILAVIDNDQKYRLAGITTTSPNFLSLKSLDAILASNTLASRSAKRVLTMSSGFLHQGGRQVVITTLNNVASTLRGDSGLWLGAKTSKWDRTPLNKVFTAGTASWNSPSAPEGQGLNDSLIPSLRDPDVFMGK